MLKAFNEELFFAHLSAVIPHLHHNNNPLLLKIPQVSQYKHLECFTSFSFSTQGMEIVIVIVEEYHFGSHIPMSGSYVPINVMGLLSLSCKGSEHTRHTCVWNWKCVSWSWLNIQVHLLVTISWVGQSRFVLNSVMLHAWCLFKAH